MKKPEAPHYRHLLNPVRLPSGEHIPGIGQGTWEMGERSSHRKDEIAALRLGIELGLSLIDTAEMYANGGAEEVVGEAMQGHRGQVFLVSKVLPNNAGREKLIQSCEQSLKRLKTDYLDLFLLHWRGAVPLGETLEAFHTLMEQGKIRYWGVSNFDTEDMQKLYGISGGEQVATNQVLYNLNHRGIEWELIPWSQRNRVPIMAYSPFDRGGLSHPVLNRIATRHDVSPLQVALAWVLAQDQVIAIPKASHLDHVHANREALNLKLTRDDLKEIDEAFPAPEEPQELEMI